MKNKLEFLAKLMLYAAFFVPLVVVPSSFIFPFIVPKILLFRSLTAIAFAAYALLLVINWREYKLTLTPLNWALLIFLASFSISTFVGVDPYHSFWDNHERMLGLFTIIHFVGYALLCFVFFRGWTGWKWALRIFLLAGSGVMLVAMLQLGNPQLLLNQGSERVASTLGNPIYVGGYALFLVFVSALLFAKEKNGVWRGVEAVAALLAVLGLFYSGTRGTMLGLFVGLVVALLAYAIFLKAHPKVRVVLFGFVGLIILAAALLFANRQTTFVQKIPAVGRTVNTTLTALKNTPRWIAWGIAVESWKKRPVFGWGPNNYFYAFNLNYNPRSLEYGYGETWFDNAHNVVMNTLAVQGGFGVLSYLAIYIIAWFSLFRAYRRETIDIHLFVIGGSFLVAHLVQNLTVFENPTSYLYFVFWLAMVSKLTVSSEQSNNKNEVASKNQLAREKTDRPLSYGLAIFVGIATALFIFIFNIQPARANSLTLQTIRLFSSDPAAALPAMKEALAFRSPHIDDIRSDIARSAGTVVSSPPTNLKKEIVDETREVVYEALKENIRLHPLDVRNYLSLAQFANMQYGATGNSLYLQEIETYLKKALEVSPRRQQVVYSLSAHYFQIGRISEAASLLESTIKDDQLVGEGWWRLAYTYAYGGQLEKAKEVIRRAREVPDIKFGGQDSQIMNEIMAITSSPK